MKKLKQTILELKLFLFILFSISGGAMAGNLERSKVFFNKLSNSQMDLIDGFYENDAIFQDPVHQLKGVDAIRTYYKGLYKNVKTIRFEYGKSTESDNIVNLTWRMYLKTDAIEGGNEITVDGVSIITFGGKEGKAIHHRDYFDMGEFVYERIPVLRNIIGYIKRRLAGS